MVDFDEMIREAKEAAEDWRYEIATEVECTKEDIHELWGEIKMHMERKKLPQYQERLQERIRQIADLGVQHPLARDAAVGGGAFLACHHGGQVVQGVMGMSCATPVLPSILGLGTVGLACYATQRAIMVVNPDRKTNYSQSRSLSLVASGVVLYPLLGGHFDKVAPSDYNRLGVFSRSWASLPASLKYANSGEKKRLNRLGRLCGCHTCGTRLPASYIADHQPPVKFVKADNAKWWRKALPFLQVTQRFFPQCSSCSTVQSSTVRLGRTKFKYNFLSLRAFHGVGLALAVMFYPFKLDDSSTM
jgi:hypothetical protein